MSLSLQIGTSNPKWYVPPLGALMIQNKSIGHIITFSSQQLPQESRRLDVELLLSHALGCDRAFLYINWDQELSIEQINRFQALLSERAKGMPIAYILKEKEFYGQSFRVEPGIFIPRPETETLVSAVLSYNSSKEIPQKNLVQIDPHHSKEDSNLIWDFGCGGGYVGLSLLAHLPHARLVGFDINKKALKLSHINAHNMGLLDRAVFIHQDVSHLSLSDERFSCSSTHRPNIIVANPPYIAFDDRRIHKEVLSFEPPDALFSDEGGLGHIRAWMKAAHIRLKLKGSFFFEIGAHQDISSVKQEGMHKIAEFKDLTGRPRVIQFQKA